MDHRTRGAGQAKLQSAQEAVEIALELYGEDSMQLSNQEDLPLVAQEALDTII